MQFLQQLIGGGLFFTGAGRQMLTGALDGKLFFIKQVLDFQNQFDIAAGVQPLPG